MTNRVGLIALLDADYGIETFRGNFCGWVDRVRGHVARPITRDMVTDTTTFSGGRKSVIFNGTTQGMTLELPELRRNSGTLIFAAHVLPAYNNNDQVLMHLWANEGETTVLLLGGGSGGYVTRVNGHSFNGTLQSVVDHTNQWYETELVVEAVRDAYGLHLHLIRNGVERAGDEGTIGIDVLSPQPASTTVSIGCSVYGAAGQPFQGAIRRLAIYGSLSTQHLLGDAASRDAMWRGN